jgi:hypothetical protein
LSGVVVIEEQDDLLKVEEVLEVGLDGLLGGLGPQRDRHNRPVGTALPHRQGVQFPLGDHDRLAASEELLAEQGPRKVTRDWVSFVLVLGLVGYKSSGVVVIGKDDALFGGIKTDPKLSTSLCSEAP